jgi:hypothetical protein
MLRNPLPKLATAAVLLGVLAFVEPGVAWAAPMASGTVTCPVVSGAGTLSPGLTAAGSPGGVKITFHAKLGPVPTAGCSSSAVLPSGLPVTIKGGKLTGSGFFNGPPSSGIGSSCANFDGPDVVGTIKAKVAWAASHAIAPSKVVYTGGTPAVSGSPTDTIQLPATGTTTTKSGSFTTPPLPNTIKLVTNIPSTCTSGPPITTFTITGGSVSL